MKNTVTIISLLALALFMSLTGCEETSLEVGRAEAFFKVKFINRDSLVSLNSHINVVNGQIRAINDSLNAIEQREENGDETDYSEMIDSLNLKKDSLDAAKIHFNEVIATINSGKIQIDRLTAEGGAGDITFRDSLTLFHFPLNSNADSSQYFVTIEDETDTIMVTYARETVVAERRVEINAYNFKIIDHTFDDLEITQSDSTNLPSNEATATFYF